MTAPVGYGVTEPAIGPAPSDDRSLAAFRALVRSFLPQLALLGRWSYRVDSVEDSTHVICSPVDASLGLPSAVYAVMMPSILGEQVAPVEGSIVTLAFIDCDASKPVAITGDPNTPPMTANLLGGTQGAARTGDSVSIGTLTVSLPGGVPNLAFTPSGGPPGVPGPSVSLYGSILGGSERVLIG